jgi:hypothetical protein
MLLILPNNLKTRCNYSNRRLALPAGSGERAAFRESKADGGTNRGV